MKISDIIDKLNAFKNKHGDVNCYSITSVFSDNTKYDANGDMTYVELETPQLYYFNDNYGVDFTSEKTMLEIIEDNEDDEDFDINELEKICVFLN